MGGGEYKLRLSLSSKSILLGQLLSHTNRSGFFSTFIVGVFNNNTYRYEFHANFEKKLDNKTSSLTQL